MRSAMFTLPSIHPPQLFSSVMFSPLFFLLQTTFEERRVAVDSVKARQVDFNGRQGKLWGR